MATTENYNGIIQTTENPYWDLSPTVRAFCVFLMCILIIIAIVGNLLTVTSYIIDKRLRTVYDFYILNLALADLLLGAFSMPVHTRVTMVGFYWEMGKAFCKTWLTIDFTLCAMSVILIILLSYDRLQLVTLGPQYSSEATMKKAYVKVAIGWILSFLLYGPAEIFWDIIAGRSVVPYGKCDFEFFQTFEYTLVTGILEFFIPSVLLAIFNFLIYRKLRYLTLKIRKHSVATSDNTTSTVSAITLCTVAEDQNIGKGTDGVANTTQGKMIEKADKKETKDTDESTKTLVEKGKNAKRKMNKERFKRERKSAKILAIIVIVFYITWAPFTLATMVISFCNSDCVNLNAYEILGWLLWSKSAINPFLYVYNSSRYKYNFKRITCFWRKPN